MKVILISNTIIGKRGNIGYRLGKIIKNNSFNGIEFHSIARGCEINEIKCESSNLQMHFARILNAFKIYVWRDFPARFIDSLIFDFLVIYKFRKLLKKVKLDKGNTVVHLLESSPRIIRACHNVGIKVVLDIPIAPSSYVENLKLEHDIELSGNNLLVNKETEAFDLCDTIICPSNFVFEEISKISSNTNKVIIPFGTDILHDAELLFESSAECKQITFCFAGNLSIRKGVNYLLEAWETFRSSKHRLVLCGRVYPEMKKLIDKKGFSNVFILGFVDMTEIFHKSDVYVFPSLMEGSSKSVYEAMSFGLPVITTFESGSLVKDGISGYIIPKLDSLEISKAMLKFVENPALVQSMGLNARKDVEEYTWERYADSVVSEFKRSLK